MERKCQNCRHVDVCLKRSLAIFNMFIVTGRYNEVENAKIGIENEKQYYDVMRTRLRECCRSHSKEVG